MPRRPITVLTGAALALGAILAGPFARAGDVPVPATSPATPAAATANTAKKVVVKLDIAEKLDDAENRAVPAAFGLRRWLRAAGFAIWSSRPIPQDKKYMPPTATAEIEDAKADPDLVIKGTVAVAFDHSSKFYGQVVANSYKGTADLSVQDASGKELCRVEDSDEWGERTAEGARESCEKRISAFATVGVLKTEPILSRIPPARKPQIAGHVRDVETQRAESGGGGGK